MAKHTTLVVFLAAAAMIFVATNAQKSPMGAPMPSVEAPSPVGSFDFCLPYLLNLSDCLPYVEQGSNLTKPDKACCPEIKTLLAVQPICLCELLAHPDQSPFPIDVKRALGLPSVCKINTPPTSACAALGVPIGAPSPSPTRSHVPAASPSAGAFSPEGLAPTSSSTPPAPGNDGQSIAASQRHILVGLAIMFFISFF